jgi:hypothetical protein
LPLQQTSSLKKKLTGCIQTIKKRKMDWLHPDHREKKNGLVASRPSRKEKWTGCIQTIEIYETSSGYQQLEI